jgi:thiamine kinase-like enzyme
MTATRSLGPAEATARYGAAIGREQRLLGPLTGGETGATAIEDVDGERRVLKWESDPHLQQRRIEGAELAERLRTDAGWPVARQRLARDDEWLFVSQEFMQGQSVERLGHRVVDDVLACHDRRLAMAPSERESSWGEEFIEILVTGGSGYCLHEPLRDHSVRGRGVLERIEQIGSELTPADLDGRHIVHADLHPGNLLEADGALSAIVDLDFARLGDPAFDLAFLAVSSLGVPTERGVRGRLFDEGVEVLDPPRRRAYLAGMLLRFLDWPIRKNRPAEVEFWLDQAERLLDDVRT